VSLSGNPEIVLHWPFKILAPEAESNTENIDVSARLATSVPMHEAVLYRPKAVGRPGWSQSQHLRLCAPADLGGMPITLAADHS
jgi:hypothetical protein